MALYLTKRVKLNGLKLISSSQRSYCDVPAEKRADFAPRIISKSVFPDPQTQKNKRGTGGRSSWNGNVVTVFGANGHLGRHLVNKLAKIGSQVIIPYRGDAYFPAKMKLAGDLGQIQFMHFHLKDTNSLYRAMKYSNVVINLIGKELETVNFDFEAVHIEGARTIARIARELDVKRLVHVSALNCTPNPTPHVLKKGSGFLKSKYYGEMAVREEFPDAIVFRPSDIFGHEDNFVFTFPRWHRRQVWRVPIWNGGYDVYKQPVFVSDVAQGIVNAITDDEAIGQTYEAVGPRRYEFREIVRYINRCIQKREEDGFYVTNLRWAPMMRLRISFFSLKHLKYPVVHWEKIEREMVTDQLTGCPTLQDLGVKLSCMEDKLHYELELYRKFGYYHDEVGEFEKPAPPEVAPLGL